MVPPVAVQVTPVLELPVTEAVNCCVPPGASVIDVGFTVTCTVGAAACMMTCAEPLFVVSATDVAVTLKVPAVNPAVNKPLVLMEPPVAVHVTAVLVVPVTVAVNVFVCPVCKVNVDGFTVTVIGGGAACMVTCADDDLVESAAAVAVTLK